MSGPRYWDYEQYVEPRYDRAAWDGDPSARDRHINSVAGEIADLDPELDGPITDRTLWFPDKLQFIFRPKRYKVAYGGRGSTKSWTFARALIIRSLEHPLLILCARELQNSIQDSVHRLLVDQIHEMGFDAYFEIHQSSITRRAYPTERRGSEFIFMGIKNNPTKVKSTEGIDIVWVEEAEKVSSDSWQILIPTIRKPGSEIWVTFNPDEEEDPTYQRFVVNKPDNCISVEVNWHDNPWFPAVLEEERAYLAAVDPDAYEHVWNGKCRTNMSAQVFRGKYVIESFDVPDPNELEEDERWLGPYFGADWGFARDPTVLLKMWINPKRKALMIEHEAWGLGVELDDIPALFDKVPQSRDYTVRCDNARPETISHIASHGFNTIAAEKWTGSVEDGVAFLKSFSVIVIHTRCRHTQEEARLYSYKKDKLTGDVLAEILDKNNHCWDAARYGLEPMVTRSGALGIWRKLAD